MPRQSPEVRLAATSRIKEMVDLVAGQSPDWGQPGAHALVYTIMAGEDSDLLEGTLTVADAHDAHHAHHEIPMVGVGLGIGAAVLAIAGYAIWRNRCIRRSFKASRGQA